MTLIPGDGIGPEISAAVQEIFAAAKVVELMYILILEHWSIIEKFHLTTSES